jgi:phosphate transport system substrate-binding protein
MALFTFAGAAHSGSVIRYEGSPAIAKFIDIANNVYGKSIFLSNVRTKSKGGENCVFAGTCDIGGVADELKPAILEKGATATLIGKDAVVVIINQDNPVDSLSLKQLRDIFSGQIKNWKELGGPDLPVQPIITSPISATHELFKRIVMDGREFKARVMEPDPTIFLYVSKSTGAIGFSSFFLLGPSKGVKAVKPDGQQASVSNPNYPLSRPLYLLTKTLPRTDVKEFLDWAVSDEGQSFLKTLFVGIK